MEPGRPRDAEDGLGAAQVKIEPATGAPFYWTISNVIAILQQIYIFKVHPPKRTQAKLMVENTIERRSREENIKMMTK